MYAPSPPVPDTPRLVFSLDERHPSWVHLESPYRQPNPVPFRNVHLSDWLSLS